MKNYILFFDVHHPDYIPLIRAVSACGFTPIINSGPLAREMRKACLPFIPWESFIPGNVNSRLEQVITRMAEGLEQAFLNPGARQGFSSSRGNFLPAIAKDFFPQMINMLAGEITVLETFKTLLQKCKPRLLVLGCDNSHLQRTLVLAARGAGLPTLQLAHGIVGYTPVRLAGEMQTLYSQYLAVFGQRSRDTMVAMGNPAERIFITGAPLWDNFYQPQSRLDLREARCRLGLPQDQPVVLFTTSYADGSSPFFPAFSKRFISLQRAVLQALSQMDEKTHLLIRPHPHELGRAGLSEEASLSLDRLFHKWVGPQRNASVRLLRDKKIEAIRAADVVITIGQSSLIAEAMILKRPVISLALFPEDPWATSPEDGITIMGDEAQLPELLPHLLRRPEARKEIVARQNAVMPEINHGHDGRATERVAALVEKLAGPAVTSPKRPIQTKMTMAPDAERSLNLLLAAHNFLPHSFAGTELYTHDLARAFERRGHRVRVIYSHLVDSDPQTNFSLEHDYYQDLPVTKIIGHRGTYFGVRNEGLKPLLKAFFQENPVDLVHIQHVLGLSVSFLEVLKELDIPTVLTLNDFWFFCRQIHLVNPQGTVCEGPETMDKCVQCIFQKSGQVPEEQLPHYFFGQADHYYSFRRAFRLPDLVLCPSKFLMNMYQKYNFLNDNLVHLPQGANLFQPLPPAARACPPVKFSYLGTICHRKGLDLLVEAFCRIDTADAELHIYGGVGNQLYVDQMVKAIPATKKVFFHGPYKPDDLPWILAATDVAVVPSRGENYPFVLREVMHARVPVVAAAIAGIPEIVEDRVNGLLFQGNDAGDLATKLALLIKQPELIETLRAGIKPMKSLDQDAADIEDYYWQTLSRRARNAAAISSGESPGAAAALPAGKEPAGTMKKTPPPPTKVHDVLQSPSLRGLSSIIIPVFNKLSLTRQCLESIGENTDAPHEIIVVDNGSSDGTWDYLLQMEAGGLVRVITNRTNLGFARASNQGARAARGEYLVFLNNDTIVQPGWLEEMVACARKDEKIGAVGAKLLYQDGSIQHAGVTFNQDKRVYHIYKNFDRDHPAVNKEREFQAVTAACMLIRRDLFFAAGAFNEGYRNGFEDVDLCFRLRDQGYKIVYIPKAVVYHLESKTPGRFDQEAENSRLFLSKWFDQIIGDDYKYYQEDGIVIELLDRQGNVATILAHDTNDNSFWRAAKEFCRQGDLDKAEACYIRALRFNPYDPRIVHIAQELAEFYETQGKYSQAEEMHCLVATLAPPPGFRTGAAEAQECLRAT